MQTEPQGIKIDLLILIADYFKVLSEPIRIKILLSLRQNEKTVSEIVKEVNSSQPNVSKHLSVLIKAGLVTRRQVKNVAYCSIGDKRIWQICDVSCR